MCPLPPVSGSIFCHHCLCAAPGCNKKTRRKTRFCEQPLCKGKAWRDQQGPLDYVNKHGYYQVDQTWPPGLQVAAKWSWVLSDIPPLDYVEFRRLVKHVAGIEGRILRMGSWQLRSAFF